MTYNEFGWTLNLTQSIFLFDWCKYQVKTGFFQSYFRSAADTLLGMTSSHVHSTIWRQVFRCCQSSRVNNLPYTVSVATGHQIPTIQTTTEDIFLFRINWPRRIVPLWWSSHLMCHRRSQDFSGVHFFPQKSWRPFS